MRFKLFQLMGIVILLVLWKLCESCKPLHLTPLIDIGNITAAQELGEVKDPDLIIPKSYAGFITTDKVNRNHLFFWFFPSINNPQAPLMVWLNGGPTVSSMFGMLYENGPIRTKTLDNGCVVFERRTHSWTEHFSMLYVDNPVGVGFSYSETNTFKTTQDEYSEELYLFLEQFYRLFPEYLSRELYIGGQSYAGKYVSAFAHQIHKRILTNGTVIPLTGIYLGGPYFDPLIQSLEFCEYYYAMGAISNSQLTECTQNILKLLDRIAYKEPISFDDFALISFTMFSQNAITPEDNYATGEKPDYGSVQKALNGRKIRNSIHVCCLPFVTINDDLLIKFKDDFLVGTKQKLAVLMDNYTVLLYTGDLDGIVTSPMVEAALMTTPWSLQEQYNSSTRSEWKLGDNLKGFYTKTGKFCRVVVHGAGHQTPHDQPESTLEMMVNFVEHGCI